MKIDKRMDSPEPVEPPKCISMPEETDSDDEETVAVVDYASNKPTLERKVKVVKRGLVVIQKAFHALGISKGLFTYDCFVDEKIHVSRRARTARYPKLHHHVRTVIRRIEETFFDATGKPIVTEILVGGPAENRFMALLKQEAPRHIAQLFGRYFVVGPPSRKSISHRLVDILITMEQEIAKELEREEGW
ncbi:uncharacterized protein LOC125030746 [Penaeus chinensis]|uniref:uncharacterized protein LOC125030746 n=1 Tax=Penaeus chinensis TaxID=139456 RepID=UPI001FB5ABC6|nr:uncharacterized protein LOC125030746 [Penaeus chinensis]